MGPPAPIGSNPFDIHSHRGEHQHSYLTTVLCNQAFDTSVVGTRGWDAKWLSSRPLRCTLSVSLLLANVLLRVHLLKGHTTPNFTYMDNPLWFYEHGTDQILATMQVRRAFIMA